MTIDPSTAPDASRNHPAPGGGPFDCAVIGGSFAGLTAALFLARARRSVIVFDSGQTRNRFADAGHGFLGMDGLAPATMKARGRADVLAYPTATLRDVAVTGIVRDGDGFHLATAQGRVQARRVILAHGMRDILPDLPGLAEGWGQWVFQCPYCHGYEAADLPTGVIMASDAPPHHVAMLRDLTGDIALFTNGHVLAAPLRAAMAARGIAVHDAPVVGIEGEGAARQVVLADGTRVARQILYTVTRSEAAAPFAQDLGCAFDTGPAGPFVRVDMMQATSQPGIFAAGDLCRPMYGAIYAAADGARAGVGVHHSLLEPALLG